MAFSFTCPECRSKLKTATAIPAGKTVQCPKCKKVFTMPEDAAEDDAPAPARASAARTPARNADAEEAPRKRGSDFDFGDEDEAPRSRRKARDDDEEEAPRARKSRGDEDEAPRSRRKTRDEEDEEETPRSRRKGRDEEDEEESPKSRRKSRDEDEEEAPKSRRKGRDEEDEDEAPKSRRRRTDDEDEEESPKSRRKGRDEDEDEDDRPRARGKANKKKKKGNPALMIAIVGGGLLGIAGLAYLLYSLFSGGSGADKEMLAFAPKDTAILFGMDVEGLMDQPKIKDQINTFLNSPQGKTAVDGLAKVGLAPSDFSKLLVAMPNPTKAAAGKGGKQAEPSPVVVIRLKSGSSLDKDKVVSGLKATKQEQNGKTYYKLTDKTFNGPGFLYMPTDKLLVLADSEQGMKDLLGKDDKEVVVGEDLQTLAKKAGGGHIWAAASASLLDANTRNMANKMAVGDMQPLGDLLKKAKGGAFWMNASSSTIDINVAVLADSDSASAAAGVIQKKFDEVKGMAAAGGPEAKQAADSFKISSSGDMLVASLSIDANALEKMSQLGGGMMPFGGGGFGPGPMPGPGPRPGPRPKK